MKNKKLVLAYSGGLDTSYCLMKLSKEGYEVHAISVNTGGFDASEVEEMKTKALQMGAHTYKSINALDSFYEKVVKYLVFGNVLKNNTYLIKELIINNTIINKTTNLIYSTNILLLLNT